jgi:uncharacterized protein (TIGR02246 family)
MKRLIYLFMGLLLVVGMVPAAWAGTPEEITQLVQEWAKAYNEGKVEVIRAQYADNAHLISPWTSNPLEGKEAVAGGYAGAFKAFPKRMLTLRQQPAIRVFGSTAVADGDFQVTVTDSKGQATTRSGRYSVTYVKLGGKWRIVDQHASFLPTSP